MIDSSLGEYEEVDVVNTGDMLLKFIPTHHLAHTVYSIKCDNVQTH